MRTRDAFSFYLRLKLSGSTSIIKNNDIFSMLSMSDIVWLTIQHDSLIWNVWQKIVHAQMSLFETCFYFQLLIFNFGTLMSEGQCLVFTTTNQYFITGATQTYPIDHCISRFCILFPWSKYWCWFSFICKLLVQGFPYLYSYISGYFYGNILW